MIAIFYVFVTTAVLVGFLRLYQKKTNAICKSETRLDGKTALVTGGTAGMGLKIAIDFANRGARVIVACPFPDEGADAVKTIVQDTGNENVVFKLLNLASLASVRQFVSCVLKDEDRLDVLINNAGIATRGLLTTKDGMNFLMQVNYFGHFLLTLLLLPLLRKSGEPSNPSRIVNTSSILHRLGKIDVDNINNPDKWSQLVAAAHAFKIYCNSKLALILFARQLTDRIKGTHVVVNAIDPGAVGTDIFSSLGTVAGTLLRHFFCSMYKTPWEGAQTAIYVAVDKKAGEVSGQYFKNCELTSTSPMVYSDETALKVWKESVRLVKISDDELYHCLKDDHRTE